MKISIYQPSKALPEDLEELIKRKYEKTKNFDSFLSDYKKSYSFCVKNEHITFTPIKVYDDDKLIAHIALIKDKRLPPQEAFFGFFETSQNEEVLKKTWDFLLEEAKKQDVTKLLGPVNGSIWHQYRCIKYSDNSEFFNSEPITEKYYYDFLKKLNPSSETLYHSAFREKFQKVMGIIETGFEKLTKSGFRIIETKEISKEQLLKIAEISRTVFSLNSWGYTEITDKEFLELYSSDKLQQLNKLYLLLKDNKIIGYCGTTTENKNTLVLKTICILPDYQGLGLGNALAYKIHLDAQKSGFTKIVYALIRQENQVKNFPKDDTVIFRRYAVFEFII